MHMYAHSYGISISLSGKKNQCSRAECGGLLQTNVDETTLTLGGGNKFQNWGRGSQGGGSRSQEQERGGNR